MESGLLKKLIPCRLAVIVTFGLLLSSARSFAKENKISCLKRNLSSLIAGSVDNARSYASEVRSTRGLRLFFKTDAGADERVLGLLSAANPSEHKLSMANITQYIPRKVTQRYLGKAYDLNPLNIPNHLANAPVRYLSARLGQKMQLTLLAMLPLDFYLGYKAYNAFDGIYQAQLRKKFDRMIEEHAREYDSLIQNDYRFKDIKIYLQDGKLTPLQSREAAQQLLATYNNFFEYMQNGYAKDSPQERLDKLSNHPLFSNLSEVLNKGIPEDAPGFRREANAPAHVTPEIAEELLGTNFLLFEKYQIMPELVKNSTSFQNMIKAPGRKDLINSISAAPYTKTLQGLHRENKISQEQLIYRLQEDAFWQNKFQLWQAVGLVRLKKINGQYTDEPLTLDDIRRESLEEINQSQGNP